MYLKHIFEKSMTTLEPFADEKQKELVGYLVSDWLAHKVGHLKGLYDFIKYKKLPQDDYWSIPSLEDYCASKDADTENWFNERSFSVNDTFSNFAEFKARCPLLETIFEPARELAQGATEALTALKCEIANHHQGKAQVVLPEAVLDKLKRLVNLHNKISYNIAEAKLNFPGVIEGLRELATEQTREGERGRGEGGG